MKLDERAATASEDLLERSRRRPVPSLEELQRSTGRDRRVAAVLAVAAVVAIVVAGVVLRSTHGDDRPPVEPAVAVPEGVTPMAVSAARDGVRLELPDDWTAVTPDRIYDFEWQSPDGDAFVGVSRVAVVRGADSDAVAAGRIGFLGSLGADAVELERGSIEGHADVRLQWSLAQQDGVPEDLVVTEHAVDLGDDTYALVFVGERPPEDRTALRDWIGSTITVSAPDPVAGALDAPAPAGPPEGVTPATVTADDVGVALQVPETWRPMDPLPGAYQFGMKDPAGPGQVLAVRLAGAVGRPDARIATLRDDDAVIEDRVDIAIDGHDTTILRYRIPVDRIAAPVTAPGSHVFVLVITEYVIDLGNGDVAVVDISTSGRTPSEIVDWVRSTISVVTR
jgi:hypothetical protein